MNKGFYFIIFLLIFSFSNISAQTKKVVYTRYKYIMGDNDTKEDAKRLCLLGAKRRCLEEVDTYIESNSEVINYQLSKDEIRTFAGAIIKIEIIDEKIQFSRESLSIEMFVKAEVDLSDFNKRISEIKRNKNLENKIIEQQKQINRVETELQNIQSKLSSDYSSKSNYNDTKSVQVTSYDSKIILSEPDIFSKMLGSIELYDIVEIFETTYKSNNKYTKIRSSNGIIGWVRGLKYQPVNSKADVITYREKRKEYFEGIDNLEKIKFKIENETKAAIDNIEIGMTPEEVERVVGKPRSIRKQYEYGEGCLYYNYGKVWVIFEGGVVSCVVDATHFKLGQDCYFHKLMQMALQIKVIIK